MSDIDMKKHTEYIKKYLDDAQGHADAYSGCKKVAVGSILIPRGADKIYIYGCNRTLPFNCREVGCRRIDLYGEDSKNHRLPSDCRSLHSEVDAITQAAKWGCSIKGATLVVTRYPCEACARAIVNAGIKKVYYGREQEISEETQQIFKSGKVKVIHVDSWTYEDTRR